MSKQTIQQLRERLKAEKAKKEDNKNNNKKSYNNIYPFWTMENEQEAVIRLLPDKNEDNPNSFYVDKLEHRISINGKDRNIPCLKMYGEECPICEVSQAYYKQGDKIQGKYFYRNKTALARVLVIKDPLPADPETKETYAGKCVNTQLSYQIMQIITDQILTEGEDALENDPWDVDNGYNFTIKKTAQGEYSTYTIGSKFSRKTSPIAEEYRDKVELIDLTTLLPKNPGRDNVQSLLNAHLTGSDVEEGDEKEKEDTTETITAPVSETKETTKVETPKPVVPTPEEDDSEIDDILALVKSRVSK
jgi:hypothetical protein